MVYDNRQNEHDEYVLSESDFYSPEDKRKFYSGIQNVYNGGDDYDDYLEYFYEMYGEDVWQDEHSLEQF